MRAYLPIIFATVWLAAAVGLLLSGGSDPQLWHHAFKRLLGTDNTWNPIFDARLPKLIVLTCSGSALAAAGAATQSLFRNPLASPSVLGITGGGHLTATFALMLGWHAAYPFSLPIAAFFGCLITLSAIYLISTRSTNFNFNQLILNGIAFSTVLIAIQKTAVYMIRDQWHLIQTIAEWEAGSTSILTWNQVHMQLPLTIIGITGLLFHTEEINLLALGSEEAQNMGVEIKKVQWRLFLLIAILTGGALAALGTLSFFCLILPHIVRNLHGSNNTTLIPLCALAGSASLVLTDALLHLYDIKAITLGNISSLVGGIFFIFLLLRHARAQKHSEAFLC